jgi:hypothetical protein
MSYEATVWGHWDLLLQTRAAGVRWDANLTLWAAFGGHRRLLQRLRHAGCPWHQDLVSFACLGRQPKVAIWAIDNGAPIHDRWLWQATHHGCLELLQWAHSVGRLPLDEVRKLLKVAIYHGYGDLADWLEGLP